DILKLKGPFTVLAPTDDAFSKLPEGRLEGLLQPENRQKLASLLKNHIITAQLKSADLKPGTRKSIAGKELAVTHEAPEDPEGSPVIKIHSATVTKADIISSNGVIHLIDTVLIPKP
ncbi:MAG: fasciclin domain-containing protein, partial [Limisphaerales bacterium]